MNKNELKIKTIEINKFRSLKKLKCDLTDISVFVGKNDAGKSNILKALNLFFNGEVEPGKKLNFAEDFNFDSHINKKADEISIKLTFSLPKNYHKNNGIELVWEKRWRADGEVRIPAENKYFYGLDKNGARKDISGKANVRALMNRITYIYVPAIRDVNYFDNLRILIYNTMTKVAENSLAQASNTFEEYISKSLTDLVNDTKKQLGEDITMSFPKNLANIFEKLDFLAGENKISLNKRGDGIKNRYIPLILNFIAQNEKTLAGMGTAPYTFLWGYEEPENNMEIQNCIELRNEFSDYVQNDIAQIILTTHSPVFYNLKNKQSKNLQVCIYHVQKNDKKETLLNSDTTNINIDMGTAALMSEEFRKLEQQLLTTQKQKLEIEQLIQKQTQPVLYVEGSTDKKIIEKLIKIYKIKSFHVESLTKSGGNNYVVDMLKAWDLTVKFKNKNLRAAGLVDEDAKDQAIEYNKVKNKNNYTSCFILNSTKQVINLKAQNKYNIKS